MDIIKVLEERGLRPTPHRVRIAQRVLTKHCHFTAEEMSIWAAGLKQKLSRATVYNILNEFVAVGLLRSLYLPSLAKTIYDSNTDTHFHLYDLNTGAIHDVDPATVKVDLRGLRGYKIEDVSVMIAGRKN